MKNVILITKDAQSIGYYPVYGNTYWKTPNINALAEKGVIYKKHYTNAVSTAMSFTSIALGKNCFETTRKRYEQVGKCEDITIFEKFQKLGYKTIMAWDSSYDSFSKKYFGCIDKNTIVENLEGLIPTHTSHYYGVFDDLSFKVDKEKNTLKTIENFFKKYSHMKEPVFIWFHLPHVLNGRNSYSSDLDMFDEVVGLARSSFHDDEIFISSDHGNMDGWEGKFGYGFDLHESAVRVPLITPRFSNDIHEVIYPTSHIDMFEILTLKTPPKQQFIHCDTAYYLQPHRKVAIIMNDYKLEFDKKTKKFRLFDLKWDPFERYNLYYPDFYDVDRWRWYSLNQRFFYPSWDSANDAKKILLEQFYKIYKEGTFFGERLERFLVFLRKTYVIFFIRGKSKKRNRNIGR